LEPHVVAALQRVRKSYQMLNAVPLLDAPQEEKLRMFCALARDFYTHTIHFTYALQCSVEEPNQPPSTTIKE
jgi:hypothetical protein